VDAGWVQICGRGMGSNLWTRDGFKFVDTEFKFVNTGRVQICGHGVSSNL
jgi:hypothetical protein